MDAESNNDNYLPDDMTEPITNTFPFSLNTMQEPQVDDVIPQFEVSFTLDATILVKEFAANLEIHAAFEAELDKFSPLKLPEFDRICEQKLAMYITNGVQHVLPNVVYIIREEDVINEVNRLFWDVLSWGHNRFKSDDSLEHILDRYPTVLLSDICKVPRVYTHMLGESMKHFVEIRKTHPDYLPKSLHNTLDYLAPLVGHPSSPFTELELEAIYRYLGARKNIYVRILLNCLYEVSQQIPLLLTDRTQPEYIIMVCKSAWLFMLLFGADQNDKRTRKEMESDDFIPDSDTEFYPVSLLGSIRSKSEIDLYPESLLDPIGLDLCFDFYSDGDEVITGSSPPEGCV